MAPLTELIYVIILYHHVYTTGLNIYTERGSTAILLCGLRTVGEQNVRWYKKVGTNQTQLTIGTRINNNLLDTFKNRLNVTGDHSIGEYNLQIVGVQSSDAGNYFCFIAIRNESIKLFIKVKLTDVLIDPSREIEVENYEVQHFTCTAKSIPLAEIQWYLNSEIISNTSKRITNDSVISTFEYVGAKYDSGKTVYCNASSDGITLRSLNAILNITYGPGMSQTLNPSVMSLVKIKDEKLGPIICAAACNPLCQYHWSKNGKVIEDGYRLFKQSLKKTDGGNYGCTAWNGFGNSTIALTLTVNYGPEKTNLFPANTTYTVQEFTPLPVINCNTDCKPNCSKYWIGPNSQVNLSDTLFKESIKRTDAGTYRCYVNNTVDVATSHDVVIIVTYGPGTSQTLNPPATFIEKVDGDFLHPVICKADCVPDCQYQWRKDYLVVRHNDTLFIESLSKTDHGTYRCIAWNDIGNASIDVNVTVNYGPEYANIIPNNIFYTIRELSSLPIITCKTDCRPICNKYWLGPNNQVVQSETLNKSSIQRKEAGTYTCYGNNTVSSSKSRNITVIVTYGASVISLEADDANSVVNESQEVNMTCHVDGVPKPKIVWTLAGDVIPNQENKTNYLFTANCEHTGNYTCTVNNNIAAANQTKEMFVQCHPRINRDKSTKQKVGLEDDEGLNITVTVVAYPAPHIKWFFQNYTISSNDSNGIFQHTTHLYQSIVDENDFGIYSLSTSNKLGKATYDISVGAKRSPDPPIILSTRCALLTVRVFWNSSFNGGDTQTFSVEATNTATKEITLNEDKTYLGQNPLNTTVHKLRPGTLYEVVVIAKNTYGSSRSEGIANCTTDSSMSEFSNITAVAAGAGTVSALIVLGIVIATVIIKRRRASSKKDHHDKEPFQGSQNEEDDNEGLKDNPMYISSGSEFVTNAQEYSKDLKLNKYGKDNKAIELGCVYENAEDFDQQGEQIYANENKGNTKTSEFHPQKNKDGLIYADLDLAPLSAERRFVIRGVENKSSYAVIDLSRKADPLPSDEEENETHVK